MTRVIQRAYDGPHKPGNASLANFGNWSAVRGSTSAHSGRGRRDMTAFTHKRQWYLRLHRSSAASRRSGSARRCCRTRPRRKRSTVQAPDVRGRSVLAEAAAQRLAARHGDRRLGRRAGPYLDHPPQLRDAAQQREGRGAQSADRRVLQAGAAGAGIRSGRQSGAPLGRPGARATNGRSRTTASTSTTRATSGSAATARRTPTS